MAGPNAAGTLKLSDDNYGLTAGLVSAVCGDPLAIERAAPKLEAVLANGDAVSGLPTVCSLIAGSSSNGAALLGRTPEQQAQVGTAPASPAQAEPASCTHASPTMLHPCNRHASHRQRGNQATN